MKPSRRFATALALALVGAGLTGCGQKDSTQASMDPVAEASVAADPHATAADIIKVGTPGSVAVSGEQSLVTFGG